MAAGVPETNSKIPPTWWRWLTIDEAAVTVGGNFREVALVLLMLALWASPRSYALAILAVTAPSVLLARWFGRVAATVPPRTLLVASAVARGLAVAALARAALVPEALGALLVLGSGSGLYSAAVPHYLADPSPARMARIVSRLRAVSSAAAAVAPARAGLLMERFGRGWGFGVSAAGYAVSAAVLSRLPARPLPQPPRQAESRLRFPPHIRAHMTVVGAVNALAWVANILYTAYILLDVRAGAAGWGLAVSLWAGAGLVSAWVLPRVAPTARPSKLLVAGLVLLMASTWVVMTGPVPFWVVAAIGMPEGFATWLLSDLLQARLVMLAPERERPHWSSAANAWSTGGRIVGLAAAVLVPVFATVHEGFFVLAALGVLLAAAYGAALSRTAGGSIEIE